MSLQFNPTTQNGILQRIEDKLGFNRGDITGNSNLLTKFTGDVNEALNRALTIIFQVGGTWQFDDSNHTDYPIITGNIVAGQRDYPFLTDQQGNLILDIQKVYVADSTGLFRQLTPVDVPSGSPSNYYDGLNTRGQPNSYEKNANGIFLDPIPNYSRTGGLKIYISREGSYFSTTDTTKKPGFAGLFHEYLVLYPSMVYAVDKGMANAKNLVDLTVRMESDIQEYYQKREKDNPKVLKARVINSH